MSDHSYLTLFLIAMAVSVTSIVVAVLVWHLYDAWRVRRATDAWIRLVRGKYR